MVQKILEKVKSLSVSCVTKLYVKSLSFNGDFKQVYDMGLRGLERAVVNL